MKDGLNIFKQITAHARKVLAAAMRTPEPESAAEDQAFRAFVAKHFDGPYYLKSYGDVADAGVDPLDHFLNAGGNEGRQISESVVLRCGQMARRSSSGRWRHYRWRRQDFAARMRRPVPAEVIDQILDQARHEPALLGVEPQDIVGLRIVDRISDSHIDALGVQKAIPRAVDVLAIVPHFNMSEQPLTGDLLAALDAAGMRAVQSIVADESSPEIHGDQAVSASLRMSNAVFWDDFWIYGGPASKVAKLAYLVWLLRPRATILANSAQARAMVARFGRALSQRTRLFYVCSECADDDGTSRVVGETPIFATALTDNPKVEARLHEHHGDQAEKRVVFLPRHSPAAFREAVAAEFLRS